MKLSPWTKKKTLTTLTTIATLATTAINGPKIGLYSVDLGTKSRKSRKSAEVYKQIIGKLSLGESYREAYNTFSRLSKLRFVLEQPFLVKKTP